ncbi:MAG: redoxin domain-containing protein [Gemmatimonadota bacterium]|nr:redoxin domain-containing protein [Gemmatimonadota bacterium]
MDAYRDQYATLIPEGRKVTLLAVSVDSAAALAGWARDADYPFGFLSDPDGAMGRAYGAWDPNYKVDNRTLYVIGPDGRIAHVMAPFREVDPQAYRELAAAIAKASR